MKNLKRWISKGYKRKKGGRKTKDPQMEEQLIKWIKDYEDLNMKFPSQKLIKKIALQLSNFKDSFKASKGWYEKFIIRYKAKQKKIQIID